MLKKIPLKSPEDIFNTLRTRPLFDWEQNYLAHFSTYWGGIVTDPRFLLIPMDDHMVHRGDGVFEAFRLIDNNFYLLQPHLDRLRLSAKKIGLTVPWADEEILNILQALTNTTQKAHLIFRLFVSRGAGSFSPNPYDCPQPHLSIVASQFKAPAEGNYKDGVRLGRSSFTQKPAPFATIKSCNYLSNVLMKKEAVDRNLDFVIAFTEGGHCAESATENILILNQKNELVHPPFSSILKGTTLIRVLELAKTHLQMPVREVLLDEKDLLEAKELFMVGTTLDIIPVAQYENKQWTLGSTGPLLLKLLRDDQKKRSP